MQSNVWIGQKDLNQDPDFIESLDKEFQDDVQSSVLEKAPEMEGNRRDFLKMLGFGVTAATVAAGCDIPVKRAIPYVIKPEQIIPGVATYYASTFIESGDCEPILVKTREGRPIKIEGNATLTKNGGTSARAQASVLSLYNINRFKEPRIKNGDGWDVGSWESIDKTVSDAIAGAGKVRFVTNTIVSPSAKKAVNALSEKVGNFKVVTYDPVSYAGMLEANLADFGKRALPKLQLENADVIVSFDADFLGSWLPSGDVSADYIAGRTVSNVNNAKMSRHFQVESHMSLTGSNADNRILVKPSEMGAAIAYLASKIAGVSSSLKLNVNAKKALDAAANQLRSAGSKGVVIGATNNVAEQRLINAINNAIGAYGSTLNMSNANLTKQGDESELDALITEIKSNSVDVIIFNQCNPMYDYAGAADLASVLGKVKTKVGLLYANNETSGFCDVIAPTHHFLESWGDAEPFEGTYLLQQPTISKIFNTRQAEDSLLKWASSDQSFKDLMKMSWTSDMFGAQSDFLSSGSFWESALHDGGFTSGSGSAAAFAGGNIGGLMSQVSKPGSTDLEIKFFETAHMSNGQAADNPWLMEMPDPVARTSWGNYLAVPVNFDGVRTMAGLNGLKDGDLVDLTVGDIKYRVPVIQQFGMMPGTVGLALGYGRTNSGATCDNVGVNVNAALPKVDGRTQYYSNNVGVSGKLGKEEHFSCVQYHHTYGVTGTDKKTGETINADEAATVFVTYGVVQQGYQGGITDRSVIYNTNVADLKDSVAHLKEKRGVAEHLNENTLYPYEEYMDDKYEVGHHWGMHVDLNSCTGCGACTVACMAENNVPVVGKREVSRHHEMTWLRIDRYYYGNVENPNVVYQPMMCQHCDNAPCENVCPVNATNHSSEGLNQMTYNRCVGTRYCANNCPYKVRRFNWMDYNTADIFPANQPGMGLDTDVPFYADDLTRMVLNPDVTVRVRGVIEKCSFCVQRIQEGKLTAKTEGRRLEDSDVKTACAAACNTNAITFGDMNNKKGDLAKKLVSPLNYIALEEVNVRSSVTYTMKVNNRDKSLDA